MASQSAAATPVAFEVRNGGGFLELDLSGYCLVVAEITVDGRPLEGSCLLRIVNRQVDSLGPFARIGDSTSPLGLFKPGIFAAILSDSPGSEREMEFEVEAPMAAGRVQRVTLAF